MKKLFAGISAKRQDQKFSQRVEMFSFDENSINLAKHWVTSNGGTHDGEGASFKLFFRKHGMNKMIDVNAPGVLVLQADKTFDFVKGVR